TCSFLHWTFTWETFSRPDRASAVSAAPTTIWLDPERLQLPLKLRTWQPGDRLQPLGLNGTKKLQDLFVDAKIPRAQRPVIPILVSGHEIVWVVGLRQAAVGKATPQTRRVLQVTARLSA
ncbi:MAG: tRNA lysidine(34) synthetase TilS, partial [Desulfobacca sp.]|uniref:tRNA lysidine(34) synthetase TilS n=1 Tax=Desulfobacca sp. TaxID=2067990 RepID=UPI0040497C9E